MVGEGNHRGMLGLDKNILRLATRRCARTFGFQRVTRALKELRELVIWAEEHSPVGRTVRDAPKNTLTIEIA